MTNFGIPFGISLCNFSIDKSWWLCYNWKLGPAPSSAARRLSKAVNTFYIFFPDRNKMKSHLLWRGVYFGKKIYFLDQIASLWAKSGLSSFKIRIYDKSLNNLKIRIYELLNISRITFRFYLCFPSSAKINLYRISAIRTRYWI